MRYLLFLLFFAFCLPAYSISSTKGTNKEECAYSTEGAHTVTENSWRGLISNLRGENRSSDSRRQRRDRKKRETPGQR